MRFANINICRGKCSWFCAYCIAHHGSQWPHRKSFASHSVNWIIDQIKLLMETKPLAIATQDIDMMFVSAPKSAQFLDQLCTALKKEGISDKLTSLNITAIPGTLSPEQLAQLSGAGVLDIDWGCETASQNANQLIQRPVSPSQIIESVKHTWKVGILPKTFWMTGLPGEQKTDLSETMKTIARTIDVGGIPRWVTPVIALPMTDMYQRPQRYQLVPRMRSFEDYMAFSRVRIRQNAEYPELITHETAYLTVQDILRASTLLREFIVTNKNRVLSIMRKEGKKFVDLHPTWSIEKLVADTELSFRNVTYGYF
jgi:radical SAM superfamily enzyme YgiQ (UPF0313 family)